MSEAPKKGIRESLNDLAKRRGLFWQPYELYGGLRGTIAVGSTGFLIKRRIEDLWLEAFVERFGLMTLDSPVLGPRDVYVASGHESGFVDKAVTCTSCKAVWRLDQLLSEDYGVRGAERLGLEQLEREITGRNVICPNCKGKLGKPFLAPLMVGANLGFGQGSQSYLRPETAQGIFTEFKRLYKLGRQSLPFGVAQIGRVFRNEISPRHGLLRLREFTIMELEMFVDPQVPPTPDSDLASVVLPILSEKTQESGSEELARVSLEKATEGGMLSNSWVGVFMAVAVGFLASLGIDGSRMRFREKLPQERAHYAKQLFDAEVWLDGYGWTELAGFAYRTDYDLRGHMNKTGEDLSVTTTDGRQVVPHVVEPSFGVERVLYAALEHNLREREGSFYLALPARIAPRDVSIFPLMDKPELSRVAKDVLDLLKRSRFLCNYDESGSIGRRYARSDEIGIPLAITIDYKTIEDNTVTIRERDTREQERAAVSELPSRVGAKLSEPSP